MSLMVLKNTSNKSLPFLSRETFVELNPECDSARTVDPLTATQLEALWAYATDQHSWQYEGHPWITEALRSGKEWSDEVRNVVEALDAALKPLSHPIRVVRSVSDTHIPTLGLLTEKSFLSTTLGPNKVASGTVRIEIDVPKGVKAMLIYPLHSGSADEREVLLERGLTLRITKVEPVKTQSHDYVVKAEVVPTSAARNQGLRRLCTAFQSGSRKAAGHTTHDFGGSSPRQAT